MSHKELIMLSEALASMNYGIEDLHNLKQGIQFVLSYDPIKKDPRQALARLAGAMDALGYGIEKFHILDGTLWVGMVELIISALPCRAEAGPAEQ
jgi:hypothetical protein